MDMATEELGPALAPAWLSRVGRCRSIQKFHDLPATNYAISATGEEQMALVVCETEARDGLEVCLVGGQQSATRGSPHVEGARRATRGDESAGRSRGDCCELLGGKAALVNCFLHHRRRLSVAVALQELGVTSSAISVMLRSAHKSTSPTSWRAMVDCGVFGGACAVLQGSWASGQSRHNRATSSRIAP